MAEIITLKEICTELKINPREAREKLRAAVIDKRAFPELATFENCGPFAALYQLRAVDCSRAQFGKRFGHPLCSLDMKMSAHDGRSTFFRY